ncbi:MAG: hypothetical protein H6673_16740 [Anaerolineales bacterium]|nr:hypothetical protein [Anaerolineales bacterium]
MTPEQLDVIMGWAGLVLTLMVFSYVIRDNFLYRIAVHVLIGAAAGYGAIAAITNVILPWFDVTIGNSDAAGPVRAMGLFPVIFGLFLVLKLLPRYAHIGNFAVLILVGIGTGVALVGAVIGTIIPLVGETGRSMGSEEVGNGLLMVAGTISTLIYFQYISRQRFNEDSPRPVLVIRVLSTIGQGFIIVTLGALYAGAIVTSLTIFNQLIADQIQFLLERIGG